MSQNPEHKQYYLPESWRLTSENLADPYEYIVEKNPISISEMSVIYAAHDNMTNQRLALKIDKYPDDPELATTVREAGIIDNINHPNIPHIFRLLKNIQLPGDFSMTKRNGFIMQYIEGPTVADLLEKSRLSGQSPNIPLLVDQLFQIADVIHYVNTEIGITHRDVKPSNIKIEESTAKPFLIDFGVTSSNRQPTDLYSGTLKYMSPELLDDYAIKKALVTQPSETNDIYALGLLAYEAITGNWPYGIIPNNFDKAVDAILHTLKTPITKLGIVNEKSHPKLIINLNVVFGKVLEKNPINRYQDPTEFIVDLSKLLIQADIHRIKY